MWQKGEKGKSADSFFIKQGLIGSWISATAGMPLAAAHFTPLQIGSWNLWQGMQMVADRWATNKCPFMGAIRGILGMPLAANRCSCSLIDSDSDLGHLIGSFFLSGLLRIKKLYASHSYFLGVAFCFFRKVFLCGEVQLTGPLYISQTNHNWREFVKLLGSLG